MAKGETLPDLARMLRQLKRRDARRRGGAELSYRALAARTGWSAGIIAHYFTGKTLPPTDRFDALVRLLGASPAEQGRLATIRDHIDEDRRQPARPGAETIRLLGPIEVAGPHGPRQPGRQQAAHPGRPARRCGSGSPVSHLKLAEALWGDELPRTAMRSLYSHVARIRQALDDCGLPGILITRDSGYVLDMPAVRSGRRAVRASGRRRAARRWPAARPPRPSPTFSTGLALWRGAALEDGEPAGWAAGGGGAAGPGAAERAGGSVGRPAAPGRARRRGRRDRAPAGRRPGPRAPGQPADAGAVPLRAGTPARSRPTNDCAPIWPTSSAWIRARSCSACTWRCCAAIPTLDLDGPGRRAPVLKPAQLPPRAGHFTGRDPESSTLDGCGRARASR